MSCLRNVTHNCISSTCMKRDGSHIIEKDSLTNRKRDGIRVIERQAKTQQQMQQIYSHSEKSL